MANDVSPIPPVRDPYSALRQSNFRFYLSAWTLAVLGQQIQSVALQWDLYRKTGDPMVLGWVGLLQAIPVISLAIPAGQLADRFDRRRVLIVSLSGSMLSSLGLVFAYLADAPIWVYYLLLFFNAVANAIGWPARSAILPQLVPVDKLPNAMTWNASFFQLAAITGPAIGGFIIAKSLAVAYCCDVLAAMWMVFCLATIHIRPQQKAKEPVSIQSLLAGVRFVFDQKIILATISLDLFGVLLGGAAYLLPMVATDILHVGSAGFGFLRAAPAVGAICMGLLITHLPPFKRAGRAMLYAVAGFGMATVVFGFSRNYWLSLAALFFAGMADNISVVVRHTLVQVLTPDEMRGRVSAVNNVFIGASNELGGFESGLTAKLFGPVISIVGGGIGTVLVVLGINGLFPQVRRFGSLLDAKTIAAPNAAPNAGKSTPATTRN